MFVVCEKKQVSNTHRKNPILRKRVIAFVIDDDAAVIVVEKTVVSCTNETKAFFAVSSMALVAHSGVLVLLFPHYVR